MQHLPPFIIDLALILGAAAVVTLTFRKLKQPVVLGYIIAGLLVGPNFRLFPTIVEIESIRTWADIGVIFLLFGLGLEFSFKKLIRLGAVAAITALFGVGFTMGVGYMLGSALGWNSMDCLFMGGILAIASTTIIIRAFEELNVKTENFTGLVTGVLIVEDLVAVLLMVLLSTVSITRSFAGPDMLISVLKLVFFLILWFVSGIFFLPSLLKALRKLLNEETLLILALALCFLMVFVAASAGFSAALGAFIMGSILAETTNAEKIEHLLKPVKNLFGAIFFVSVGMLIDPQTLFQYSRPILFATLVLLFGKPLFVASGALLAGLPLKTAVQSGMSLSQIGEFSFIIATLGVSLNVTSDFLYPVAVAVSVLTTFTTPYMIRFSPGVYNSITRAIPQKLYQRLNRYSAGVQTVKEEGDWKILIRFYLMNVVVFSVIILTIILFSTRYVVPYLSAQGASRPLTAIVLLAILSPFLWALAFRRTQRKSYANVWVKPLQRGPLIILLLSRMALALFYVGLLLSRIFSPIAALYGVIATAAILLLFNRRIKAFYSKIELRFLTNLNERETGDNSSLATLAPWDTHLSTFEISPNSDFIGKTLEESRIREQFGVNIAVIERGNTSINVPDRFQRLYPYDQLAVIGTDEQLKLFKSHIEAKKEQAADYILPKKQVVSLHHITVGPQSTLLNRTIRNSGIREQTKGLVVGIERQGKQILNPESDFRFQENDLVWIVGNEKRIQILSRERSEVAPGSGSEKKSSSA